MARTAGQLLNQLRNKQYHAPAHTIHTDEDNERQRAEREAQRQVLAAQESYKNYKLNQVAEPNMANKAMASYAQYKNTAGAQLANYDTLSDDVKSKLSELTELEDTDNTGLFRKTDDGSGLFGYKLDPGWKATDITNQIMDEYGVDSDTLDKLKDVNRTAKNRDAVNSIKGDNYYENALQKNAEENYVRTYPEEIEYATDQFRKVSNNTDDLRKDITSYLDMKDAAAADSYQAASGLMMGDSNVGASSTYSKNMTEASRIKDELKKKYRLTDSQFEDLAYYGAELDDYDRRQAQQEDAYNSVNTGDGKKDAAGVAKNSVYALGANIMGGVGGVLETAKYKAGIGYRDKHSPMNVNSDLYAMSNITSDYQGAAQQRVNDWNTVAGMVYGAGMSAAESLETGLLAPWGAATGAGVAAKLGAGEKGIAKAAKVGQAVAGLTPFGANAFASQLSENVTSGQEMDEAMTDALISAGIEVGTELLPFDNFWETVKKNSRTSRKVLINFLAQSGIEGLEEGAGDIADLIIDQIRHGDQSDFNQSVQAYMDNNPKLSEDEARSQATKDFVLQTLQDVATGALSGAMGGAGATVLGRAQASSNANKMFDGFTQQDYADIAADIDSGEIMSNGLRKRSAESSITTDEDGIGYGDLKDLTYGDTDEADVELERRNDETEDDEPLWEQFMEEDTNDDTKEEFLDDDIDESAADERDTAPAEEDDEPLFDEDDSASVNGRMSEEESTEAPQADTDDGIEYGETGDLTKGDNADEVDTEVKERYSYLNQSAKKSADRARYLAEKYSKQDTVSAKEKRELYYALNDMWDTETKARQEKAEKDYNTAVDELKKAAEYQKHESIVDAYEKRYGRRTSDVATQEINLPEELQVEENDYTAGQIHKRMANAKTAADLQSAVTDGLHSKDYNTRVQTLRNLENLTPMLESKGITEEEISSIKMTDAEVHSAGYQGTEVAGLSNRQQQIYNIGAQEAISARAENNNRQRSEMTRNAASILTDAERTIYEDGYQTGMNAGLYDRVIKTMSAAARSGVSVSDAIDGVEEYLDVVGGDQKQLKETLGKVYANAVVTAMADANYETARAISEQRSVKRFGKGTYTDMRSEENKRNQIEGIDTLEAVAKITGLDIVLVDDNTAIGHSQGSFVAQNSTIYLNAGKASRIASTLYHELGEFASVYSPEEFQGFVKAVNAMMLKKLGAAKYNEVREDYLKRYAKESGKTDADLDKEIACDMLYQFLGSKEGMSKLMDSIDANNSVKQATSIKQKLADWISRLSQSLKDLFAEFKPSASQQKVADAQIAQCEELVDMLNQSIAKAVDNYRQAQLATLAETLEVNENPNTVVENVTTQQDAFQIAFNNFANTYNDISKAQSSITNKVDNDLAATFIDVSRALKQSVANDESKVHDVVEVIDTACADLFKDEQQQRRVGIKIDGYTPIYEGVGTHSVPHSDTVELGEYRKGRGRAVDAYISIGKLSGAINAYEQKFGISDDTVRGFLDDAKKAVNGIQEAMDEGYTGEDGGRLGVVSTEGDYFREAMKGLEKYSLEHVDGFKKGDINNRSTSASLRNIETWQGSREELNGRELTDEEIEMMFGTDIVSGARNSEEEVQDSESVKEQEQIELAGKQMSISSDGSYATDTNGKKYAVITMGEFSNNDIKKRLGQVRSTIAKALAKLYGKHITINSDGTTVEIDATFAHEFMWSQDTQGGGVKYRRTKLSAHKGIELIVEGASNPVWRKNYKKSHAINAARGWRYYDAAWVVKNGGVYSLYQGTLNVRMDLNGTDYIYEINNIKEVAKQTSGITTSAQTATSSQNVSSAQTNVNLSNRRNSLSEDSNGAPLTDGQREYFKDESPLLMEDGKLKRYYHGTARMDRIGTVFRTDRATSGPMAFFTDNQAVAASYARDKKDTSLAYDERYDSYATQFRLNVNGQDMSVEDAWNELPAAKRAEIQRKAEHVTFDNDAENIVYDERAKRGVGDFDQRLLREHDGNYLAALRESWLDNGNIYGEEYKYLDVLRLVGIDDAQYLSPDYRDEGVYEVYLHVTNPLNVAEIPQNVVDALQEASEKADYSTMSTASADMWDKHNISPAAFMEKLNDDIATGTTRAWTSIPDWVTDTLKVLGYDGITDVGGKYGGNGHQVVIPFESNQVKSIDNENPSEDVDIRRSIDLEDNRNMNNEEISANRDEVAEILQKGAEALKGTKINEDAVRDIAREMKRKYSSSYDMNQLTGNLTKLFAYLHSGKSINYSDFVAVMQDVARPVIDAAYTSQASREDYAQFRNGINDMSFSLTAEQRSAIIDAFGSMKTFERYYPEIHITEDGSSFAQQWGSLVEMSGGLLDEYVEESDMPTALVDAMEALRPSANTWQDSTEAAHDMALDIIGKYLANYHDDGATKGVVNEFVKTAERDLKAKQKEWRAKAKADYEERLKAERAYQKEIAGNARRKAKARKEEQIAKLRAKNATRISNIRERQRRQAQLQQINKTAGTMYQYLTHPTDQNHIPADCEEMVLEIMASLDMSTPDIKQDKDGKWSVTILYNRHEDKATGRNKFDKRVIKADTREEAIRQYNESLDEGVGHKKWYDRMKTISDMYDEAKDAESFDEMSGDLADFVQGLSSELMGEYKRVLKNSSRAGVVTISELNSNDLKVINNMLKNVLRSVNMVNRSYSLPSAEISGLSGDIIDKAERVNGRRNHKLVVDTFINFMTLTNANPHTFFHAIGADHAIDILINAQNTQAWRIKEANEYSSEILEEFDSKTIESWDEKQSYLGGKVVATKAQMMTLYELLQRADAYQHLLQGGIKIGAIGGMTNTANKVIHLTEEEYGKLIDEALTDEEKEVADKLQQFLAVNCSAWGNETSMQLYGYEKFLDEHYWPMTVDKTSVNAPNAEMIGGIANTIKNMGMTKAVVSGANNALVIDGAIDVYAKHVSDMATYSSWTAPIQDLIRMFNYKERTENENGTIDTRTTQQAIETMFGKGGTTYFKKLMASIQKTEQSSFEDPGHISKLIGNAKKAATMANIRVVVQQPTAIMRAGKRIDYGYLQRGVTEFRGELEDLRKQMIDSDAVYYIKQQGNIDGMTTQNLKTQITGIKSFGDRVTDWSGWLAGKADQVTWDAMYRACIAEQIDVMGRDKIGTQEFQDAVNYKFDHLMLETQVYDGTITRTQFMRATDMYMKNASAFMAEPMKTYNLILSDMIDVMQSEEGSEERKAANRAKWKTVGVLTATAVANSVMQSLWDAVRHAGDPDDEDKNFVQRFIEAMGWDFDAETPLDQIYAVLHGNLVDNLNMLNNIPMINDLFSGIDGAIWNQLGYTSYSSNDSMDSAWIDHLDDMVTAYVKMFQAAADPDVRNTTTQTGYAVVNKTARVVSDLTGLPVYAAQRDLVAAYNQFGGRAFGLPMLQTKKTSDKKRTKNEVSDLIREGGSLQDIKNACDEAASKGNKYDDISSGITSAMKSEFIELYKTNKSEAGQMKSRIAEIKAYCSDKEGTNKNMTHAKKVEKYKKEIDKWVE